MASQDRVKRAGAITSLLLAGPGSSAGGLLAAAAAGVITALAGGPLPH